VWDDSSANITISGHVYSDEGSNVSTVCDSSTQNIYLVVAGLTTYTTSCDGDGSGGGTGAYSISGITYSPGDSFIVYISGEPQQAASVSKEPISNISNMDLYEHRVIVRHEGASPISIADMAAWDSSDDADVPFSAVTGGTDTLTLPSDTKLIVWTSKTFAPAGDVSISGGGGGAAYDGTLELYTNAAWTGGASESYNVGGSMLLDSGATLDANTSTFTFTTTGVGRTIDVNSGMFYDLDFNGSGDWTVSDANLTVEGDLTITSGDVTLPTGTTTIAGSLNNTGGSFDANGGVLSFTSTTGGQVVKAGGSDMATVRFIGAGGGWVMSDANATATGAFTVATGSVTLPSGVLALGQSFVVDDTVSHNNGTLRMTKSTGTASVTLNGNDLYSLTTDGGATFTLTDTDVALLGDLTITQGTFISATGTLSIGGSFDATGGIYTHASGTVLFNSSDIGETVDPGANVFYNVQFASPSGGWTLQSATTTNNFSLVSANSFTFASGATLTVNGIFTNTVGGAATTWSGTVVRLLGGTNYTINNKTDGGDLYEALDIAPNTDIRSWDSSATTLTLASSSSLYSQDHAGVNGSLYIYGDYHRATGTDYWSYATDFDGASLSGANRRQASVHIADGATTTIEAAGGLEILGDVGATTTIGGQGGGGMYAFNVTGGTFEAQYYSFRNLNSDGITFTHSPMVTSLSNGAFELAENGGVLIRVSTSTINANASKVISHVRFTATTSVSGYNISLSGGTTTNAWTFTNHTGALSGELYDIDGGSDCGSIRWDDSTCLLLQETHYRFRNDDGGEGAPSSEWYDTDWGKRKRIRVDNADASTYADAAIKLTVSYDSDMQPGFGDLRFTDSSGTTTIPYWIEKYTASTEATVWVQVPTLAANDLSTIYMYYDNSTATSSASSTAVFSAADDFEDGNISEYSGDTSLFTDGVSHAYGGSYGLDASGHEGAKATDGIARPLTVSQGEILRYMEYVDTSAGSADEVCTLFGVQGSVTNNQNYAVCIEQFGTDRVSLVRDAQNTETSAAAVLASSTASYATGWYAVEVDWQTDNDINVTLYNSSGAFVASTSANDSTYTSGGIGFTFWGQHGGWDDYTARPRVDTEPTIYFGAEQTSGGATWATTEDTPATSFDIGETARLRVAIENSGLDVTNQHFRLEYAAIGTSLNCESVDYASYAPVPNQTSCGTSPICMESSTYVSDSDTTTDHLSGTEGSFIPGSVVTSPSNESNAMDVGQNEYTEFEYAITPTVSASDAYCFRVTNSGSDLDSYTNVPELQISFAPTISSLSLNDDQDILLSAGTTTRVYATGTISDLNGYTDFEHATTTIFRSGVGGSCTPDKNNCYISSASQCSFKNCSGNNCNVVCSADIYYYADPTDSGTYAGESWRALLSVDDHGGAVATATAPSIDLMTLRAIAVTSGIDYGALSVNHDTGSYNATTSVENIGNDNIDLSISGTDLTDGSTSNIPVSEQKFATSSFTYGACTICSTLSSSSTNYKVGLTKPTTTTPAVSKDIYWGIKVPYGVAGTAHHGNNTFYAIGSLP
jgi:hypothetical protein